jgi:primosomal protein N' (replication factor Y)
MLSTEVAELARQVADRGAGTLSDVLRLAVPPRHARAEKGPRREVAPTPGAPEPGSWSRYPDGPSFLEALQTGRSPRAVWSALPGPTWAAELAAAVQATLASGRGALVVVPDARDAERLGAAVRAAVGDEAFVVLTADLGPAERYRRFLGLSRGAVRAVVGTRAAAFAPVAELGLVAIWDDGDDLHDEPRAPYPHARDVLVQRAHQSNAAALLGGFAPSVDAQAFVERGWARALTATRATVHATAPRVEVAGSDFAVGRDPAARTARLPDLAFDALRAALAAGRPALLHVPRRGYQLGFSCADCRSPARCRHCEGPLLRSAAGKAPTCGWCGRAAEPWTCVHCRGTRLRSVAVGERRTAEELARAFPDVPVLTSAGEAVRDAVPDEPALVVATPGAEPVAAAGYGTVLLLDAWSLLGRPDLRAAEEALRRWCNAAALARSSADGGQVVLVGAEPGVPAVQALVRWDPRWFAETEARSREALGFPPAVRLAAVEGLSEAANALVDEVLAQPSLDGVADVLGPIPLDEQNERLLLRVPRRDGPALAAAVADVQRARRPKKGEPSVRVRLDPAQIG